MRYEAYKFEAYNCRMIKINPSKEPTLGPTAESKNLLKRCHPQSHEKAVKSKHLVSSVSKG